MSDFLEACRREWRRLGVPGPVAEEMAADLAADLRQADAEGVPAEEVLGAGIFDPAGFAAAWAAERGVIPAAHPRRPRRGWPAPVALACFLFLALLGAALAAVAFHGANLVGTVHGGSPGLPPHGFVRHVASPQAGLRPLAAIMVAVGLAGAAATAVLWLRDRPGGGGTLDLGGLSG